MDKFKFPKPNFNDKNKFTNIKRYARFYLRKFIYFNKISSFEKLINKQNNEVKKFFQNNFYACYNSTRRFCDKSFTYKERVDTLIYDVNFGLKLSLLKNKMIYKIQDNNVGGGWY